MSITSIFGKNGPIAKQPKNFPTEIEEDWALGLDLGIGSCGQAVVSSNIENIPVLSNLDPFPDKIGFLGVRAFDIPEMNTDKGVKLKNPERRDKRLSRRTTRRRAWRMWEIKRLFKVHSLLPSDYPTDENLWKHPPARNANPTFDKWRDWHSRMTDGEKGQKGMPGPWRWRVKGLDEKLDPLEWAAVLLHIAKHRGFKSNKKSAQADDDGGKVLQALKDNAKRMEEKGYRTVGEMLNCDPNFADKKRNSSGDYKGVILRSDQEQEIKLLFEAQRKHGSRYADIKLEDAYLHFFNAQYPLQNPVKLLGDCPFELGEKRAPSFAYSFELSRALQRLNVFKLNLSDGSQVRFQDYVNAADNQYENFISKFAQYGVKSKPGRITWKNLREIFDLPDGIVFDDLPNPLEKKGKLQTVAVLENEDFLTGSNANAAAKGSYLLHQVLGDELWQKYAHESPKTLDDIAFGLTFFEEIENDYKDQEYWGVINQLRADEVPEELIELIRNDLESEKPTLHKFAGTASMSLLASRKLLPRLRTGEYYSQACTEVYGDHRHDEFDYNSITNPVVKSVVKECLKQVVYLISEMGKIPGKICVELSRDLGKSVSERNEISNAINKRRKRKNANRENLKEHLNRDPNHDELLRYELYLEQTHSCPYCGHHLGKPAEIMGQEFQVDHILPRSRSHDNSYDNKVLVHTRCNQEKKNATPFEYYKIGNGDKEGESWNKYCVSIRALRSIRKRKRLNLLNTNFAEKEAEFASRNLNDSRYIARLVTHYLQEIFVLVGEKPLKDKGSKRRVFVQPGSLTSLVRKAWGLENLKKDRDGERLGDKHHAVDALICALLSEGQRQFITTREQNIRAAQQAFHNFSESYEKMEAVNDHNQIPRGMRAPWSNFRADVVEAIDLFTVSRRENRKGRGSLHNDTVYSVVEHEGKSIAFTRKSILSEINGKMKPALTKASISKIKGIDDPRNEWLLKSLSEWINNGSPIEYDQLPKDPQGAVIKKVNMEQGKKSGRQYPQGYVTGGDQVRLDVFSKSNKNGVKKYFLVPIYAYHISNSAPPNRAIVANKVEELWTEVDDSYFFEFSLWKNSRVEIKKNPTARKPAGEEFIGLYKGIDRNTGAFQLSNPEDSQDQQQFTAKTGTILFRKIETDRLGREFIVKKETRTWRGKNVN